MLSDRASCGFLCIRLGINSGRHTSRNGAPVIKHPRDVPHLIRTQSFDEPQSEVMVLRSLKTFPKTSNLPHEFGLINAKVIDIILPQEKFGIPIGLEVRAMTLSLGVDLVFVGINEPRFGMLAHLQRDAGQRVSRKQIVLIEQGAPFAGGERKRRIGTCRDPTIFRSKPNFDPRIAGGDPFEPWPNFRITGSVIRDAKFPALVNLCPHRIDRRFEQKEIGIVNRHENRDQWLISQLAELSPQR